MEDCEGADETLCRTRLFRDGKRYEDQMVRILLTKELTPSKLSSSGQKESHSIMSLLNDPVQPRSDSVRLPSLFSQTQERQTAPKYYLPESQSVAANKIEIPHEVLVISDGDSPSANLQEKNQLIVDNKEITPTTEIVGATQNMNQNVIQNAASTETKSSNVDDSKLKLTKSGKPRKPRMTKKEKEAKLAEAQPSNGLIAAPLAGVKDDKKPATAKRKNESDKEDSKTKKNKKDSNEKDPPQKEFQKDSIQKEGTPKPEAVPNPKPLTPLPAPSLLDVIDKGDKDKGIPEDPVIALEIPLCSDVNPPGTTQVVFNLMKLCEDKYGFKAMNPHAKLPQDIVGEDDVEILDDDEDDEPEEEDLNKKQNRKIGKYDVNDPFIDDAELLWEEQRVGTADGFFVYYGPLSEASLKVEKDVKKPTKTTKKTAASPKRKVKPASKKKSEEVPNTPTQTVVVDQVTPSVT